MLECFDRVTPGRRETGQKAVRLWVLAVWFDDVVSRVVDRLAFIPQKKLMDETRSKRPSRLILRPDDEGMGPLGSSFRICNDGYISYPVLPFCS